MEERDTVRMQGLQQSLLEERKLYCFVIDQYCVVVRNEIAWNAVVSGWAINMSAACIHIMNLHTHKGCVASPKYS